MAEAKAFNYDKILNEICGGSKPLAQGTLDNFLSFGPTQIQEIRDALDNKDLKTLRLKSHSLKGMASYVCADVLTERARIVQFAIDEHKMDGIEDKVKAIEEEMALVLKQIGAKVKELK